MHYKLVSGHFEKHCGQTSSRRRGVLQGHYPKLSRIFYE